MTWRTAAIFSVFGLLGPRTALAAELCPGTSVNADAGVRARWPGVDARIREALAGRTDIDPCAKVRLFASKDTVAVDVTLTDGRSTRRSFRRPEDVVPTVEALLLVPEPPGESEPPPVTAPPERVASSEPTLGGAAPALDGAAPPLATALEPDAQRNRAAVAHESGRGQELASPARDAPPAASHADAPSRLLGFEIALTAGLRAGDGQKGATLGVLSFLDVHGWLVGAAGAAQHFDPINGDPPTTVLDVSALGGRRFHIGGMSLDFVGGPGLALWGTDEMVSVQEGSPGPITQRNIGGGPVLRALVGVRVNFNARSALRPFAGVDGELALSEPSTAAGRLPVWSAGLNVGVAVGTHP